MAIEVSLCGPGSLLTSTLGPTETLCVVPGPGSGANPGAETVWNLFHQVGWLYVEAPVLVTAEAGSAEPTASARLTIDAAAVKARSRAIRSAPFAHPLVRLDGMLAREGNGGKRDSRFRMPVSPNRDILICRTTRERHRARSLRRDWHHRGNEQFTFPPLPRDHYPSSGHALPDLPPHRRLPARQPHRGPDRALPPGPPHSARPPLPVAGPAAPHHTPIPPRPAVGPDRPCRRARPQDASRDRS